MEGRLTERSIRRIIIRRARDAGVKGRISGNGLRVGGAQSLAAAGASLVEMQFAGRWRSPVMPCMGGVLRLDERTTLEIAVTEDDGSRFAAGAVRPFRKPPESAEFLPPGR